MDKSKKKDAVKKVIAAMTVGKDVSVLFPDVVNCMQVWSRRPMEKDYLLDTHSISEIAHLQSSQGGGQMLEAVNSLSCMNIRQWQQCCSLSSMVQTDDLELKKLVYLYVINYAKTQPDWAIMGVNTFVKVRPTS